MHNDTVISILFANTGKNKQGYCASLKTNEEFEERQENACKKSSSRGKTAFQLNFKITLWSSKSKKLERITSFLDLAE